MQNIDLTEKSGALNYRHYKFFQSIFQNGSKNYKVWRLGFKWLQR